MEKQPEKKVLGIISIIIGVIALILSWVPIINNFAAVLAVIGLILGVIALLVNRKHKKLLAWLGTIFSIIAFAIVMGTQSMYSNAIDDAAGKNDTQTTNKPQSSSASSKANSSSEANKTFNVGDTVSQKNGMDVKVDSVEFKDGGEYDDLDAGKQFVVVHLTLVNNGNKTLDYNEFDYRLDDNGKQTDMDSIMMDDNGDNVYADMLESGSLRPNSSMSGTLIGQAVSSDKLQLVSNAYDNSNNWTINLN
ncbi:DUF4352 domain-containing protein [Weissella bombi]|uniref:DUF4352 domain-containing protein n=1 Tax=Weissella bombi TaxID=1505725 RepID=A0A1C4C751_9LACO|nr:DUF4352 domain-containing protein [Weissella bombi]SCC14823.1 protein of unknown function [Weissella bombi]